MARPASKPMPMLTRVERPHHRHAEAVGADQRRDHHHRQRQHDGLGEPGHDRRAAPRAVPPSTAAGAWWRRRPRRPRCSVFGTEMMPRWVRRIGAGSDEDDGDDQAGRDAEAEQDQRRDEIDEGRQRLHQVEHRQHDAVDLAACARPRCRAARRSPSRRPPRRRPAPASRTVCFQRPWLMMKSRPRKRRWRAATSAAGSQARAAMTSASEDRRHHQQDVDQPVEHEVQAIRKGRGRSSRNCR